MRNIVFLGLISFFMDVSSEMVYPIIPLYLTAAFGAGMSMLAAELLMLFFRQNGKSEY